MPELLTKYPKIVMSMLSKMGAICKKGYNKKILTNCPTKNFCSIPGVGEFCVLGTNQADKLTQFKAIVEPELTGGQNKLNSFELILLLLLMILLFLVICLVCSTYYEFKRYKERRKSLITLSRLRKSEDFRD